MRFNPRFDRRVTNEHSPGSVYLTGYQNSWERKKGMFKKSSAVALTVLLFCGSAHAAQSVVEAFGCNLNDGKTMDDLMAVAAHYEGQRSKIDSDALQKMRSVVWTPIRGSAQIDFVWFNTNLSYSEWGEVTDAWARSNVAQSIQARFDEVSTCGGSGLYANQLLFSNDTAFKDDGGVMIESYRCNLRAGKSMADSDKALDAWRPVFEKHVEAAGVSSFVGRRTPIISGNGFDLSYIGVWDDATTFAAVNEAILTDPNNRSGALFEAAHSCESALFNAQVVVPPAD
jgi:hypothetical protein